MVILPSVHRITFALAEIDIVDRARIEYCPRPVRSDNPWGVSVTSKISNEAGHSSGGGDSSPGRSIFGRAPAVMGNSAAHTPPTRRTTSKRRRTRAQPKEPLVEAVCLTVMVRIEPPCLPNCSAFLESPARQSVEPESPIWTASGSACCSTARSSSLLALAGWIEGQILADYHCVRRDDTRRCGEQYRRWQLRQYDRTERPTERVSLFLQAFVPRATRG
jgi:hypothetical protein